MLMKIEKINDNQIRCTLTKEDLASRQLKLSELAYGTEKAKRLFREMMQQANFEFGFEAEDIPLMIEAIPMNAECIVLLITKVEDPEELDTRFARFSPSENDYSDEDSDEEFDLDDRDMMDLHPLHSDQTDESSENDSARPALRIFTFRSLSEVMNAAAQVGKACTCINSLYKDPKNGSYLLVVERGELSPEDYNRICNTLSEYGSIKRGAMNAGFLEEHFEVILADQALQNLAF